MSKNIMQVSKDISYGDLPHQKLDLYLPESKNGGIIVYFHGGGIESGDKADKNYAEIAEQFGRSGYAFASVNYLMYPSGARYPDYIVDCAKAVGYVKKNLDKYALDKLYVSGQSAGAWISLMLCLGGGFLSAEGVDNADISGWIIDSAQTTSHFNVLHNEKGLDKRAQRIDEFSPMYYLDENPRFSRMLLLFYSNDMPCRKEQNLLFFRAVKTFNPDADLEFLELEGGHCQGSIKKDENGNYPYAAVALQWLEKDK